MSGLFTLLGLAKLMDLVQVLLLALRKAAELPFPGFQLRLQLLVLLCHRCDLICKFLELLVFALMLFAALLLLPLLLLLQFGEVLL